MRLARAALFLPALLSLGSPSGVAPWDVPDALNPDFGLPVSAPAAPDPPGLIRAEGTRATLPNGISVELLALARRRWCGEDRYRKWLPDARPAWRPDGAAYLGTGPQERPQGNVLWSHPTGGLMPTSNEGKEYDDRGARYLAFRFTGPPDTSLDLDGYVPDFARRGEAKPERHGWDVPIRVVVPRIGPLDYETEIEVDHRAASRYRLALASGEWKTISVVDVDEAHATGISTLARGEWGELKQDASPLDRARKSQAESLRKNGFAFGPSIPPRAHYAVVTPEPPLFATRLRLVDAQGQTAIQPGIAGYGRDRETSQGFRSPPVRVEVETRPYTWIEFSNVHYDPDAQKWPPAYWGAEGEKTESRSGETVLQAIVVPDVSDRKLVTAHVYAPDGRLWRNHPRPDEVSIYWPDLDAPGREKDAASKLMASIHLDPALASPEKQAWIEGFASEGADTKAFGPPLDPPRQFTTWLPAAQYRFVRPKAPYVRFGVRYALPWKKVAEFAPPTTEDISAYAKDRTALIAKFGTFGVVQPSIHSQGSADMELVVGGERQRREGVAHWTPADPLEVNRIVARLRDGTRHPIGEMAGGVQGYGYAFFTLDEQGRPFYKTEEGSILPKVRFLLSDVEAFEVEAQDYTQPVYVVAKLPSSP